MDFNGVLTNHKWEYHGNIICDVTTIWFGFVRVGFRPCEAGAPRQAADILGSFQLIPSEHPKFDASFPNLLDGIWNSVLQVSVMAEILDVHPHKSLFSVGFDLQIIVFQCISWVCWTPKINLISHNTSREKNMVDGCWTKPALVVAPEVYLRWPWHQPAPEIFQPFPPCSLEFQSLGAQHLDAKLHSMDASRGRKISRKTIRIMAGKFNPSLKHLGVCLKIGCPIPSAGSTYVP